MKYGLSLRKAEGIIPHTLPNPLKLNLGCGRDIKPSFLNLDLYSDNPEVIYCDVRILPFADNSADLIIANDILDTFSHREIDAILKEWRRVLKSDAEILIRVPNLKAQVETYLSGEWDADVASYMLLGAQTNPVDYRCAAFDIKSISAKLLKAGFTINDIQELIYSQDRGFLNQKITIKAVKVNSFAPNVTDTKADIPNEYINAPTNDINKSFEAISVEETEVLEEELDYSFLLEDNKSDKDAIDIDRFIIDDENPIKKIDNVNFDYRNYDDYDLDLLEEIVTGQPKSVALDSTASDINAPQLNIVWEGSQFVYHSLALINREHCYNIIKSEVAELTIIPYEPDTFDFTQNDKYNLLASKDIRYKQEPSKNISQLPYCWIRHQWPPKTEAPKGAKWIIMQPWEFSCLRKDFADLFAQADEIWTPSNFSRISFINSGIDGNKIQVIPNGINPDIFSPSGLKYNLNSQKKVKLLFVGGTIFRKGIDLLLRAFVRVFNSSDDICLVIKDIGGKTFYKGQTSFKMIEEIQHLANAPEIIYIDDELSEYEMAALYRACDVFVSPYRGEGFSLPTLEAMACGLPVIVTEGGPTDDFVDEAFSLKVKSVKRSIGNDIDGHPFVEEAYLLEPDIDDLTEALLRIKILRTNLKSMGMLAQYIARTDWTWERATIKLLTRLDYLYGTNMAKITEKNMRIFEDASTIAGEAEANYIGGDYEAAENLFLQAIKLEDISKEYKLHSLHRLAVIFINQNDEKQYESMLKMAIGIVDKHPDTIYVQVIKLASENRNVEAINLLSKLVDEWEQNIEKSTLGYTADDLLVLLGDLFYSEGDSDTALKVYTAALKLNNNNEYACYGAGICFRDSGINDHAKTMLEWAINLNPDFALAQKALQDI